MSVLRLFISILATILLLGMFSFNALSAPNKVIKISDHLRSTPLGNYMDFYMDQDANSNIINIQKIDDSKWQGINEEVPNFGHSKQIIWLRLEILNDATTSKNLFLSLDLPTMNDYQVFIKKQNGELVSHKLGDLLPFEFRLIENRNFVVPFTINPQQKHTFYLRLKSHESIQVPLYIRNLQEFEHEEHQSTLIDGLYLGIMLIMVLYNFAIYYSVQDKSYLFISLYIFSESVYQLAGSGLGFQHIWPSFPLVNNYIIVIAIGMMTFSLSIFMYSFLQISKNNIIIRPILLFLMFISIFTPTISLFDLHLSTNSINLVAFVTLVSGMVITTKRYLDGLAYARLFVAGFAVLLSFLFLLLLNRMGIIPRNLLTENGTQLGDVITVLLMSMALVQRIKFVQEQKTEAEQKSLLKEAQLREEKERNFRLQIEASKKEIETKEKIYMARAESKAKSDFLAIMSHEIRTPMNGVLGMVEILSDTKLDQQQKHYVEIIQESGNSLLHIINDILDFSKIEAGKIELEEIDFDLHQLCQECISSFAILAKSKHIELSNTISPETKTLLCSDPTRIKQILLNLLSNSFKFTNKGSVSLRVSTVKEHDNNSNNYLLKFEVTDTGIGISEQQKEKLFSHFSQADNSTTRKYGGTGLGLAISKQLSNLLGGEIGVESKEGVGTTFWFTVNLTDASEGYISENFIPTVSLKHKRILFVDDSPSFLDTAKEIAVAWGMKVEIAYSSDECLEKVESLHKKGSSYDIISLDMNMPGKSGLECAKIIKENSIYEKPKLLLLTSMVTIPNKDALAKSGIDKAIQKPASASFLLETIISLLDKKTHNKFKTKKQSQEYLKYLDHLSGRVALVAEDNITNQIVIKKMLQKLGISLTLVSDGEQAYEFAKENHSQIDFVLMDCEMPIMDGYQTTLLIREWEKQEQLDELPIIALTAHALNEHRQKASDSGMNAHVTKPVDLTMLSKTLSNNINKNHS